MVSILKETPEETAAKLERLMPEATVDFFDGPYAYAPCDPADGLPENALALVRYGPAWCALLPAQEQAPEKFVVWRFTFPPGRDNSGFVGWFSTLLKQEFGAGAIVVCGDHPEKGGIYDYYGVLWDLRDGVKALIGRLQSTTGSG